MPVGHLKDILASDRFKDISCIDINQDKELIEEFEQGEKHTVCLTNNSSQKIKIVKCPTGQQGFLNSKKKGYIQICDYLIFIPSENKVDIILCELKKKITDKTIQDGEQQIKSTIPLVNYILSAIKIHHGKEKDICFHYIIIGSMENRRGVRKREINDTEIKVIISETVFIKKLIN